jgi:hypothetical protein
MNAVSLSAGGVGADGATTYVEEIIQTAVVYGDAQSTATIPVQTVHGTHLLRLMAPDSDRFPTATLVADASAYRYAKLPGAGLAGPDSFGVLETCTLDGGGGGTCVAQAWANGGETATTTFMGAMAPFYTLTIDRSTAASVNVGSKIHRRRGVVCVVAGILAYLL